MTKTFNWRQVSRISGSLLITESFFLMVSTIVAFIYKENDLYSLISSTIITALVGLIGILLGDNKRKYLGTREGYLIVGFVWIIFSFFGMMPFYFSGYIPSITDAYFETMSGFTTTGASILTDVEKLPHGLLFWRSMTQWLGGMGIVVLTIAILPVLNGSMQLFMAEAPGVTYDKIQPRLKDTARNLWGMYAIFTLLEAILLNFAGMDLFDAVCHSFTTLSSGGYSTKAASIGHWSSPAIQYIVIFFMIVAGTNFSIIYGSIKNRKGQILFKNEEFHSYIYIICILSFIIFLGLLITRPIENISNVEEDFRASLFQVVSILTTTGYCSENYLQWHPVLWLLLALITSVGASAGSTAGGIKILRLHIIFKNVFLEFKRIIHPKAIMPVRVNGRRIHDHILSNIYVFLTIFITTMVISIITLMICGLPSDEAFGCVATSMANVGPGLGSQGPSGNYAMLPVFAKWYLSFLMMIGRLELFTFFILIVPNFWKKQ